MTRRTLREDMDGMARRTWRRVASGDVLGIRLREDTLTEVNLLDLSLRHPEVRVTRFKPHEEFASGGDWEWFVGSGGVGWFALRIQAKRMDRMSYNQLDHSGELEDEYQFDTLIRSSSEQTQAGTPTFPYYVFFNGWEAGWPPDVAWNACPYGNPPAKCRHHHELDYGCAAAPAPIVRQLYLNRRTGRRSVRTHLRHCVPWSWLFGPPLRGQSSTDKPRDRIGFSVSHLFAWHRWLATLAPGDTASAVSDRGNLLTNLARRWSALARSNAINVEATEGLAEGLPHYAEYVRQTASLMSSWSDRESDSDSRDDWPVPEVPTQVSYVLVTELDD